MIFCKSGKIAPNLVTLDIVERRKRERERERERETKYKDRKDSVKKKRLNDLRDVNKRKKLK